MELDVSSHTLVLISTARSISLKPSAILELKWGREDHRVLPRDRVAHPASRWERGASLAGGVPIWMGSTGLGPGSGRVQQGAGCVHPASD